MNRWHGRAGPADLSAGPTQVPRQPRRRPPSDLTGPGRTRVGQSNVELVEIFDEAGSRFGGELPAPQAEAMPPQRREAIGSCLLLFASSMRETDAYRFGCSWNVAPSASVT